MECGRKLHGRPDKKFCSTECKNRYNNRRLSYYRKAKSDVLTKLDRNHEMLDCLCSAGVYSTNLEDLISAGFSMDAVTAHRKGPNGHEEYGCYDIFYCRTASRIIGIHREWPNPEKSL